ncbi:MAG: PGN_0703 family putative restriction endonuclease, partial [Dongiaceae bacterium]
LRVGNWRAFQYLEFEKTFPTGLPGTPPHLDVFLSGRSKSIATESKCIEHLGTTKPEFKDSYERVRNNDRQSEKWLNEMQAIREKRHSYRYLDAAQLIKHAFGIANSSQERSACLLYLYWEPSNASEIPELKAHQRELAELTKNVVGGFPSFHAMTYRQLWGQWEKLDRPSWLREHAGNLRRRYDVEI